MSAKYVTTKGRGFAGFPCPAPRWCCSEQRLRLRDELNTRELDAIQLVRKYDLDNNGFIDPDELPNLLRDYHDKKEPVTDGDIEYVMAVADKNQDAKIDSCEVLFGLRAWYALTHMAPLNLHFEKFGIVGDKSIPMPQLEDFQRILEGLNQDMGVKAEEAEYVRQVCANLGAEEKISHDVLRKAVAAWYLNVERADTSGSTWAYHLLKESCSQISTTNRRIFRQLGSVPVVPVALPTYALSFRSAAGSEAGPVSPEAAEGPEDCALHPNFLVAVVCFPLFIGVSCVASFSLPLYYLHIARANPHLETCESELNLLLQVSCVLWLASVACNLCHGVVGMVQPCLVAAQTLFEFIGIGATLISSPANCGETIYRSCHWWFCVKWLVVAFCVCMYGCFMFIGDFNKTFDNLDQEDATLSKDHGPNAFSA